jgi:DNA-3-methyladenine glycosylase I
MYTQAEVKWFQDCAPLENVRRKSYVICSNVNNLGCTVESLKIRELGDNQREWARKLLLEQWGSMRIMSAGKWHEAGDLPGFVAYWSEEAVGLATYYVEGDSCELVTLNSTMEGYGVGSALLAAVRNVALAAHCTRLWLTTSNDNLRALQFYQKREMQICAVHRYAVDEARRFKPIPLIGANGIPLRDEIELEMPL